MFILSDIADLFGHDVVGNDFSSMVFARNGQDVATTRALNDDRFTREVDDWGYDISEDPKNRIGPTATSPKPKKFR